MIYHMENEKNRIRSPKQSRDDFSGCLSEEALQKLIAQVETEEMLRAPAHLKENVLTQIRRERRAGRKRQVFVYRAKVLIAMAAALVVLLLVPAGDVEETGNPPFSTGNSQADYQPEESQADKSRERAALIFLQNQAGQVTMEQAAMDRQREIDDKWEQYREERESGGIRGMLEDINARVAGLGRNLFGPGQE